jgi:hypothetical protein
MANYTYAQLITEARDLLRDPAPGTIVTDNDLTAWADRGARNISAVTMCWPATGVATGGILTQYETVTTVANTYRYTLQTQFVRVFSVTFEPASTTPYGLQKFDVGKNLGRGYGKGESGSAVVPRYYDHFGAPTGSLYIWPAPIGAANIGAYIKVYGAVSCEDYMHTEYTTEIYGIPDRLQHVLLDFVLSCAYQKRGQFQKASLHMQQYLYQLELERKDVLDRKITPHSKDMYDIPTQTVSAQQA